MLFARNKKTGPVMEAGEAFIHALSVEVVIQVAQLLKYINRWILKP